MRRPLVILALAGIACASTDPASAPSDASTPATQDATTNDAATADDAAPRADASATDGDAALALCPDGAFRCDDFERAQTAGQWAVSALEGALLSIDATKANTGTSSLRVEIASPDADARAYLRWPAASGASGYQEHLEAHFSLRADAAIGGSVDVVSFEFVGATRIAAVATPNSVDLVEVSSTTVGNGNRSVAPGAKTTASAWHRFVLVFDRASKTARLDGAGATKALSLTHGTFDHVRIGAAYAMPQASTYWIDDVALVMR